MRFHPGTRHNFSVKNTLGSLIPRIIQPLRQRKLKYIQLAHFTNPDLFIGHKFNANLLFRQDSDALQQLVNHLVMDLAKK